MSRLLSILHQNAGGTTLDGATYTYDNAGNRTSKTNAPNGITEGYTYDPLYQLTQVTQGTSTTESYTYDPVGNRLSSLGVSPYNYNSSNQLTSIPGTTFTYDSNGSLASKSDGTTYAWDYENRLKQVTLPGTGGTVTFKYDPMGRRIQKAFTQGATTTTTNYVYDGANAIEEVDANVVVLARYTQGQGIDEPLAELRFSTTSYYNADGLGSITSLANAAGALANTYTYDSFGKLTASAGTVVNPFEYTARDYDSESGLRYYRARYYDQNSGRFISEDRLRFKAAINYYLYVQNKPINAKDPSGLEILYCSRDAETLPGNHSFLYNTLNGDNCGKGSGNHPHGHESITAPGTFCNPVPGSTGQEDAVMKCCRDKAASFWGQYFFFPWAADCHNLAGDCLTKNGLKNPGAPGGRLGCRGNCPSPAESLTFPPGIN